MRPVKRRQGRWAARRFRPATRKHLIVETLAQRQLLNASMDWLVAADSVGSAEYSPLEILGGENDVHLLDGSFSANDVYADPCIVNINGDAEGNNPFLASNEHPFHCTCPACMGDADNSGDQDDSSVGPDSGDSYLAANLQSEYILYLDFDGGVVESRGGDFWLGSASVDIPAFDLGSFGWAGREAEAMDYVLDFVSEDYAAYNVAVTDVEPSSSAYTTIYVGGDNSWFSGGGSVIGVASYDVGNRDPSNFGFIFTEELSIYQSYSNSDLVQFSEYVANVISHEAAHTFGANHVSNTTAIMNPYLPINPRTTMFGSGAIPGSTSVQDTQELLADNVGYAASTDDYGDSHAYASAIPANTSISGLLERRDDIDVFTFTVDVSGPVSIDIDTPSYGNLDSLLTVYADGGAVVVAQNDNSDGKDSFVSFEASGGQVYTITVASASGNSSGTYTLSLAAEETAPRMAATDDVGSAGDHTLHFGAMLAGSESTGHIIIANEGSADLVVSDIITDVGFDSDWSGQLVIAPDEVENIAIMFNPAEAGSYSGTITVYSNDANTPSLTFALAGVALEPEPAITLRSDGEGISESWDLGDTERGSAHSETLIIANDGDAILLVNDIEIAAPFTITSGFDGTPISIGPGEASFIVVSVSGELRGELVSQLVINSNDPDSPTLNIDLSTDVVAGMLEVHEDVGSPDDNEIDFGDVYVGETVVRTVTLINTGDGPLTISTLTLGGNFDLDALAATALPSSEIVIQPGAALPINVTYAPTGAEDAVGALTIVSDDTIAAVDLMATGHDQALSIGEADGVNDGALYAGRVGISGDSTIVTWELTNNANVPMTVALDLISGVDVQLVDADSIILAGGQSTTVSVQLTTDYAGRIADTLTLEATGAGTINSRLDLSIDAYALVGQGESYSFTTSNDERVTISLSGAALAEVSIGSPEDAVIESITLLNANGSETLKISARRANVQLGQLTGTGDLKSVKAGDVDLTGAGIGLAGGIERLLLADVLNDADIVFKADTPASVTVGRITGNSNIDIDGMLQRFDAIDFADGSLECDGLGGMAIAEYLDGDVTVTQANLDKLLVRNGDLNGDLDVRGDIGRIMVRSGAITGSITAESIGRIASEDMNHAGIVALGSIGRIDTGNDIVDSIISVGCESPVQFDRAASHFETNAYLGALKVKGSFSGSVVAVGVTPDQQGNLMHGAPGAATGVIGTVDLGNVEPDNDDNLFGVIAGDSMSQLRIGNTKVMDNHHRLGDFVATVLGA